MICDRCGRLLNRATGRCVCADYAGAAPPPVALTHPPAGLTPAAVDAAVPPAPTPPAPPVPPAPSAATAPPVPVEPPPPVSMAAAVAALDLRDRPVRTPSAAVPVAPPTPRPAVRAPGEATGVLRSLRAGRRARVDVVAYEGRIVLARPGAATNLLASQLAAQDAGSRVVEDGAVDEVRVREDGFGGRVEIDLRSGERLSLSWSGRTNRGVSAEGLLAAAFPGKVDQGPSQVTARTVRVMAATGVVALVAVLANAGLSVLLRGDPPPPPAAAPPVTLAPAEQAAQDALGPACSVWSPFAASVPRGERPDPRALRPVADAIRPGFDAAAAAVPALVAAREEVVYLQGYGKRPAEEIARESSSRITFAIDAVTRACGGAGTAR